jgi:hypothetical protein
MTGRPRLDQEPLDSPPKQKPNLRLDDSSEATVSSQFGLQEDDLVKNQWIPFATTAVFLLLMAVFVSFVGSVSTRVPDPTLISPITPTINASPNIVILSTATNLPIPTIEASTRVPISLRVLASAANVRAAPSTSAKVIGQLKKDSLATPLARSDDGRWFLVISPESGMTGWVANELFETISGDPKTLPTVAPFSP